MATPADQRLLELCDKWLKSLELHVRYAGLDSDSYWRVQPWPEHQRPSRWIIDLAAQKTAALRAQVLERIKQGDGRFSDSLELMTFLANLIGSEHIERFIPLADPETERDLRTPAANADAPPPAEATSAARSGGAPPAPAATEAQRPDPGGATATREMPQFAHARRRSPPPVGTHHVARTERRAAIARPAVRPAAKHPVKSAAPEDAAREQVIADAARLVQWGRKWYELAELIARMADRPPLAEVRRILKDNKPAIEKRAGGK